MTTTEILSFDECCHFVNCFCPDPYAKAYAQAWLDGRVQERTMEYGLPISEGRIAQAHRILANIERWRGPTATVVRHSLKAHTKTSARTP